MVNLRTLLTTVIILSIAALPVLTSCHSDSPPASAAPIQVPSEGRAGQDIIVRVRVTGTLPCELLLTKSYKTDANNYFSPYTSRTLAYPGIDNTVTWLQNIPWDTAPGRYVLKVMQMESPQAKEGMEIFSQTFLVE